RRDNSHLAFLREKRRLFLRRRSHGRICHDRGDRLLFRLLDFRCPRQSFFFEPSAGALSASVAISLMRLSIARARLASTALSSATSKLMRSDRPCFTPFSPSRNPSSRRVSCSVVMGEPSAAL